MDDGYAPATIKQAAAAIGAGARAQGLPDPRGPLARQALAGVVRYNAGEGYPPLSANGRWPPLPLGPDQAGGTAAAGFAAAGAATRSYRVR